MQCSVKLRVINLEQVECDLLQPITSTPGMEQADSRPSRRFERRPVKANAFIHFRGLFQPAKVIDYSDGGVQLDGTFGLIKTDRIQIEFISGTRVPGRVAWSLGAQTGVVFFPTIGEQPSSDGGARTEGKAHSFV